MFGLCGLIYFALGAGAGMLADRYGPRVVSSAGMLFIAAGLLASSWASSMTMVIVAYGVGVGVGIGLVYTPSIGCVQPWFTRRRGVEGGGDRLSKEQVSPFAMQRCVDPGAFASCDAPHQRDPSLTVSFKRYKLPSIGPFTVNER